MSKPIIEINEIGKCYRIGSQKEPYLSLRDEITKYTKQIFKGYANLNSEDFWALRNISFNVNEGEAIGIIGRNGAGKSTLLKLLSQITPPTEGKIIMRGYVASLLEVGTGFHPELTGRENIFLNGTILGMSIREIRGKFDEIVDFAEIENFLDTPVKRYSSGMYVRLAFAVAAHLQPEILVVDEVLAVGDNEFQKKCLGKMDDVTKGGRTVLFVSHNLAAIKSLCKKTVLLEHGRLTQYGRTDEIINRYISSGKNNFKSNNGIEEKYGLRYESILLLGTDICDTFNNHLEVIYCDMDFNLNLDFKVNDNGASIGFTFLFYDDENRLLFSTINNHEKNWYGKSMPPGQYRTKCTIPKNLLNNGSFTVNVLLFGMNFSNPKTFQNIFNFEILDSPTIRGDFFGDYCAPLRPFLNWETGKVEARQN